jgi:uncharacterized FlgJ-related protein
MKLHEAIKKAGNGRKIKKIDQKKMWFIKKEKDGIKSLQFCRDEDEVTKLLLQKDLNDDDWYIDDLFIVKLIKKPFKKVKSSGKSG